MTNDYVIPDTTSAGMRAVSRTVKSVLALFVALGVGLTFAFGAAEGLIFALVFVGIFAIVTSTIVVSIIYNGKTQRSWKAHSFNWYRESFPDKIRADGRIVCRHCGDNRVAIKNLMNRTFMRSHSCVQCGETLYFSPERV